LICLLVFADEKKKRKRNIILFSVEKGSEAALNVDQRNIDRISNHGFLYKKYQQKRKLKRKWKH